MLKLHEKFGNSSEISTMQFLKANPLTKGALFPLESTKKNIRELVAIFENPISFCEVQNFDPDILF